MSTKPFVVYGMDNEGFALADHSARYSWMEQEGWREYGPSAVLVTDSLFVHEHHFLPHVPCRLHFSVHCTRSFAVSMVFIPSFIVYYILRGETLSHLSTQARNISKKAEIWSILSRIRDKKKGCGDARQLTGLQGNFCRSLPSYRRRRTALGNSNYPQLSPRQYEYPRARRRPDIA
jgi:hypothetical protein